METGGEAIKSHVQGHLGVLALNRPERLNALTLEMVRAISAQLQEWREDPDVRAVLFRSAHQRGFCSGGDVRRVREQILAGRTDEAFDFFDEEYAMNGQIAAFPKPVIALCDGVVMGGGIGIAGHADFRFASTRSRFAMPEGAIGFFCDVGANAILARAPLNRALLFLMCGAAVSGADAMALGLTDCVLPADRLAEVENALSAAVARDHPQTALAAVMQAEVIEPGEAELCADADLLEEELALPIAEAIVRALQRAAVAYPQVRDQRLAAV
jgi:enoyl-CoA hydratase